MNIVSLRLTSTKTLPILIVALERLQFTQTELSQSTGISIGRVNKIISWLKSKGLVTKEKGKYVLTHPNKLTDIIADQQLITQSHTYYIAETKELNSKGTRCLKAVNDKELNHYIYNEELKEYLDAQERGETTVILYSYNNIPEEKECTGAIRTIIDLKSVGEREVAEKLAQEQWRTRQ